MLLQSGRRTFAVTIAGEHGGIVARDAAVYFLQVAAMSSR